MPSEPRPSRSTYAGLFFVALATLMYEILLTRIFSVTMLYHFAFVALSVAMFGMTAGALGVYLAPAVFTPDRLREHLARAAVLFGPAIVLSFLTQLSVPFRVHPSIVAIYAIGFTYAVVAVPFVVSGVAVCLALTGYPGRVSRLYAADLAGAALGCVLLIVVLDYSDGPTAVLWVATLAALGGTAFARDSSSRTLRMASVALAVALAAAAALASGLPFLIVRKEAKGYGTERRIEGEFEAGEEVCLVEDVVTSGGAAEQAVEALREAGLVCRTAICVVDREEGGADALARKAVRLTPIFRASDIVPA